MIYSGMLNGDEPQRQEKPADLSVQPTTSKRLVTVQMSVDIPFGSTFANVMLYAVCEETGEILDSITYGCYAWEVNSALRFKKEDELSQQLIAKGHTIKKRGAVDNE